MAVRLISSAVGIIIGLVVLYFHNTIVLNIAVAAISTLMLFELFRAARCIKLRLSCVPAFAYGIVMPFISTGSPAKYKFEVNILFAMLMFITFIIQHNAIKYYRFFYIFICTILVSNSMCCLIQLNRIDKVHGLMYLVMGLCGAWLADSGAYFSGTFLGKHKLCPEISPKKTVEGFIGGIVINGLLFMLINYGYSKILFELRINYAEVFIIGALLAVVGTIGDLSASIIKRQCSIKDYGNIMPGHGGAMDRFDSVLFVAPCLYAFVSLVPIYK